MKIVIDARFWGPSHTGLGVYTRELVQNLALIDNDNDYTVLLRKDIEPTVHLPANFTKKIVEAKAYTVKEQFMLVWQLYRQSADLVHFPSINVPLFYFRPYVVTVHDLIKHQSRGPATSTHHPLQYWFKYVVYLALSGWVVKRAKHLIVPTEAVKKELAQKYNLPANKVSVTYEAAALGPNVAKEFDFPDHYAIYTGNAYPHKNLQSLIDIWPGVFEKTKMSLIISSGRDVFTSRIEKLIHDKKAEKFVHYMGFLTDDQLASAYSHATMYVFPTLLEGFGLPGLDAMNFGLPVVCSDIPVLREVYGPAALYFNPKDKHNMQETIVSLASDDQLRKKLIVAGKKQVKKYSWQKMARETLVLYKTSTTP